MQQRSTTTSKHIKAHMQTLLEQNEDALLAALGGHIVSHTIGVREAIFAAGDMMMQLAADVSTSCSGGNRLIPGFHRCGARFSSSPAEVGSMGGENAASLPCSTAWGGGVL